MIVSGMGAKLAENNLGKIKVTDYTKTWAEMASEIRANSEANHKNIEVTFDGSNGSVDLSGSSYRLSFKLLVPNTATAENPAPAIVTSHGFYNNKEMQDAYYVELARRGFVVISLDLPGHGGSDPNFATNADIMQAVENTGAEACVEWLASQAYVDETKIGLTGHSMGSIGNVYAIIHLVNAGHPEYVKANLAQAQANSLPMFTEILGSVPDGLQNGIIAAKYDEFGIIRDDTYNYPTSSNCIEIIKMADPSFDDSTVIMNTWYTADGPTQINAQAGETIDETASIAYWIATTHPLTHFSSTSAGFAVDFFYDTLGIPSGNTYIGSEHCHLWFVKECFNLIGLIGFFLLIVPIATLLLRIPIFSKLIRKSSSELAEEAALLPSFKTGWQQLTFWVCGICIAIITAFMLEPLYIDPHLGNYIFPTTTLFPQPTTNTISLWISLCALVIIVFTLLSWAIRAIAIKSERTRSPFASGSLRSIGELLRALLFGFTVVLILYIVVWAQYDIWGTDFRFWTLAVFKFPFFKLPVILRYLPFFLLFFTVNAISNISNRFKDVPDWLSTIFVCLFNVGGYILVWVLQYGTMITTGDYSYVLVSDHSHAMFGSLAPILLIPIFFTLIISTIVTRKLYNRTGNVWVAATVNGILNAVILITNTFTQLAYTIA